MTSWRPTDYLGIGLIIGLLLLANWLVWRRRRSAASLTHLWISTVLWIPGASMLSITLPWSSIGSRYGADTELIVLYDAIGCLCAAYLFQGGWQASRAAYGKVSLWWLAWYGVSFIPRFFIFGIVGAFGMAAVMSWRISRKPATATTSPPVS